MGGTVSSLQLGAPQGGVMGAPRGSPTLGDSHWATERCHQHHAEQSSGVLAAQKSPVQSLTWENVGAAPLWSAADSHLGVVFREAASLAGGRKVPIAVPPPSPAQPLGAGLCPQPMAQPYWGGMGGYHPDF